MSGRTLAFVQLVIAGVALAGSVLSWLAARSTEQVPPMLEGEPTLSSTVYSPSLVLLALILAGVAGVAVVAGVTRLLRFRRAVPT